MKRGLELWYRAGNQGLDTWYARDLGQDEGQALPPPDAGDAAGEPEGA